MILINLKKTLNLKYFLLVSTIFICISKLGINNLSNLNKFNYLSIFDVILYVFGAFNCSYNLSDNIYILTIYITILFIVIKFISLNLSKDHFIHITKTGSLSKYIIDMLISMFIFIFIYFLWGYIIILLSSNYLNYDIYHGYFLSFFDIRSSYLIILFNSFIINILTSYSISILILILSILLLDQKLSFLILVSVFAIGSSSKFKFIPGFHIILYHVYMKLNSIYFILNQGYIYIILIILSKLILFYICKYKKELIYNYIES